MVGEISLLTAAPRVELWELWQRTGRDDPPFWAYPWAGGQGLARYILDNPGTVRGRRVLDVASGSGLVAIAAAKAGAAEVIAGDIDPLAVAAIAANAAANGVAVDARVFDLAVGDAGDADVILAGDVFYQRQLAELALRFLRAAISPGAEGAKGAAVVEVLVADPGRAFVPAASLTALARYQVPVLTEIEDAPVKAVTVYRLT
jgi:predicted nicotinamide N-methyase